MQAQLIKIAWGLVSKFVTQQFAYDMVLITLKKISESTDNDVDDKIYESVKKALGR